MYKAEDLQKILKRKMFFQFNSVYWNLIINKTHSWKNRSLKITYIKVYYQKDTYNNTQY